MDAHRLLGAFILATVVATACGGGGDSPTGATNNNGNGTPTTPTTPSTPGANQVIATSGSVFNPSSLAVPTGTTVTFTFESVQHNVVFDTKAGAPANIAASSSTSVTRTFTAAGSYPYQCTIHSGMQGAVTVN